VAPRGRVTLQDAAELAGVSYATAYRRVNAGEVASERDEAGVITVARPDVKALARRPKAEDDRRAVMLRPELKRYAAWERAAGDKAVSVWLGELADTAAGWKGRA
jgi:hypothetical protein